MASELRWDQGVIPAEERLNVFALVIYIPGPLGLFLDELRRDLVPDYDPHAHVSVLPPRTLAVGWQAASEEAEALTASRAPFEIELTDLAVFPVTGVVYLEVGQGGDELRRMHAAMNANTLAFQEPFAYHPHVTLAQEFPTESVAEVRQLAARRWRDYPGKRTFLAERAVLVQNTLSNRWLDLRACRLGSKPSP
jgi:2'-5' RNA ligase